MSKRRPVPLKTRLAATLCQMLRPNAEGNLERIIDYQSAKAMTEDQVLSLFHFDHDPIPKHRDGPDEHWNLTPRPAREHRAKTAAVDTPGAAKDKRIIARQAEFRRKMLAKIGQVDESVPPSQRQKKGRPIDGSRRSRWKKRMDGTVERRS